VQNWSMGAPLLYFLPLLVLAAPGSFLAFPSPSAPPLSVWPGAVLTSAGTEQLGLALQVRTNLQILKSLFALSLESKAWKNGARGGIVKVRGS